MAQFNASSRCRPTSTGAYLRTYGRRDDETTVGRRGFSYRGNAREIRRAFWNAAETLAHGITISGWLGADHSCCDSGLSNFFPPSSCFYLPFWLHPLRGTQREIFTIISVASRFEASSGGIANSCSGEYGGEIFAIETTESKEACRDRGE